MLIAIVATGCRCPVPPGGPTAVGATYSMSLAPGDFRYYDVDIPPSTTQLNLNFVTDSSETPFRLRQIDPGCIPGPGDTCSNVLNSVMSARPQGVLRFSTFGSVTQSRTRVVIENTSTTTLVVTLEIVPWRAGCT